MFSQILGPEGHHPKRITKADKKFSKRLDFNDIKFPVKVGDIQKIEKNPISINVFGDENKEKHPIYGSKNVVKKKNVDLLLIGEESKRQYVIMKDFKTFMYDHTLYRGRKLFYSYCSHTFSKEELLKRRIKIALKLIANKRS